MFESWVTAARAPDSTSDPHWDFSRVRLSSAKLFSGCARRTGVGLRLPHQCRTKAPSRVCIIGPTGTTVVTANCIGDNGVLKPTGDWRDARVIVTGARGFIGSHLCRWLVDAG